MKEPDPDRHPFVATLERIRELVHFHLDQIEILAKGKVSSHSETEHRLQQRIVELEDEARQRQEDQKQWERVWQENLQRLEEDRRLLAEAWERLERERLETRTMVVPPPSAPSSSSEPTSTRPVTYCSGDDPVTRAVLDQFRALRRDVRRTAEARRSG